MSTSASSPALPSGYTLFRRIGSVKTEGSVHFTAFTQKGDLFQWTTHVTDINTASATSGNYTLPSVPLGIATIWQGYGTMFGASAGGNFQVTLFTPGTTGLSSGASMASFNPSGSIPGFCGGQFSVLTNTSQQISFVGTFSASVTATTQLVTSGWIDRRGRDD